jgi:hypothetical protein
MLGQRSPADEVRVTVLSEQLQVDAPRVVPQVVVPQQRGPSATEDVPAEVIGELRHISECYAACRAKADRLRHRPPSGDERDRESRENLQRSLQHLHELRERRDVLLEAYDLSSRTATMR